MRIYGAEIKRLLYTAEQTRKLLAETDASQVWDVLHFLFQSLFYF
jgi:hypothetical protein